MSTMVVARFESVPSARSAAHALITDGFPEESICMFYGNRDARLPAGPDLSTRSGRWCAALAVAALAALGALAGLAVALIAGSGWREGAEAAAGVGAYAGALLGALWMAAGLPWQADLRRSRQAGREILLVLQLYPVDTQAAISMLRDAGCTHVEQATGPWVGAAGSPRGLWEGGPAARRMPASRRPGAPHRTQWQP